jgi:hypothetical protein
VYEISSGDSEVAVEDRFKDILREALIREELSATDLSREVGLDKAYFVDLLAGRKKTVSALAFMLVAKRLGLDPWGLSGVEHPERQAAEPDELTAPPALASPQKSFERVAGFGIVEEGAFRLDGRLDGRSFAPIDGYPIDRQEVLEVRGHDYVPWGLPSGAVVHAISFPRYETVSGPGRLVVASQGRGGLTELVLRRIAVDPDGEMHLVGPTGMTEVMDEGGRRITGLVAQTALPAVTA